MDAEEFLSMPVHDQSVIIFQLLTEILARLPEAVPAKAKTDAPAEYKPEEG